MLGREQERVSDNRELVIRQLLQEIHFLKMKIQECDLKFRQNSERLEFLEKKFEATRQPLVLLDNYVFPHQPAEPLFVRRSQDDGDYKVPAQPLLPDIMNAAPPPPPYPPTAPAIASSLQVLGAGQSGSFSSLPEHYGVIQPSTNDTNIVLGNSSPSTCSGLSSPTRSSHDRKRVSRIVGALPSVLIANPIAALINFCKHQLRFDLDFKSSEDASGVHHVEIYFPDGSLTSRSSDRKKRAAKEAAAKLALIRLNQDEDLLYKWIDWACSQP